MKPNTPSGSIKSGISPQFGPPEDSTCDKWRELGFASSTVKPGVSNALDLGTFEDPFVLTRSQFSEAISRMREDAIPLGSEALQSHRKGSVLIGRELFKVASVGISGVHNFNGSANISVLPNSLLVPVEVGLWALDSTVTDRKWSFGKAGKWAQPFIQSAQYSSFPLIGELFVDGEPVSTEVLNTLGIRRAAFRGQRKAGTEEQDKTPKDPASTTALAYGGRSLIVPSNFDFPLVPLNSGGYRVPTDAEFSGPESEAAAMVSRRVVAIQYIGVGIRRYLYHFRPVRDGVPVGLGKDETALYRPEWGYQQDKVLCVQSLRYAGKAGVFLDQPHQPLFNPAPTGGQMTAPVGMAIDRYLLESGAEMSGIIVGDLKVLEKAELDKALGRDSKMVCPELRIACRLVFDDTVRLDQIASESREGAKEGWSEAYRLFLESRYGNSEDTTCHKHLEVVGKNIGQNLRVCFGGELTTIGFQNTMNNLSSFGRIVDGEGFRRWRNPIEFSTLATAWCRDLHDLISRVAPNKSPEVYRAPFQALVKGLYGDDCPSIEYYELAERGTATLAANCTASMVNGWLVQSGLGFDREAMIKELTKVIVSGLERLNAKDLAEWTADAKTLPLEELSHSYLAVLALHFGQVGKWEIGPAILDVLTPQPV